MSLYSLVHVQFNWRFNIISRSIGVIPPNHGTSHPVVYESKSKKIFP